MLHCIAAKSIPLKLLHLEKLHCPKLNGIISAIHPYQSPSSMIQISSMLDIISVSVISFISEQICRNQQFLQSSKHLSYWQFRISIANSDLVQIIFIDNLLCKQKSTLSSGMAAPSESMDLCVDKIFSLRR